MYKIGRIEEGGGGGILAYHKFWDKETDKDPYTVDTQLCGQYMGSNFGQAGRVGE